MNILKATISLVVIANATELGTRAKRSFPQSKAIPIVFVDPIEAGTCTASA